MESTTKPTTENRSGEKSPLDRLREFATATADINPHLLGDIERGWINPHGGLMEFVERVTPELQAVVTKYPCGPPVLPLTPHPAFIRHNVQCPPTGATGKEVEK